MKIGCFQISLLFQWQNIVDFVCLKCNFIKIFNASNVAIYIFFAAKFAIINF